MPRNGYDIPSFVFVGGEKLSVFIGIHWDIPPNRAEVCDAKFDSNYNPVIAKRFGLYVFPLSLLAALQIYSEDSSLANTSQVNVFCPV